MYESNPRGHSLQQNKKAVLTAAKSQSLYSRRVAETVKKGVFRVKQKKWTPPLNSAYSNFSLNWHLWFFGPDLPKEGAIVCASTVVTGCIKFFRTGADRHNGILIYFLLLVAEAISSYLCSAWSFDQRNFM